MTGFPPSASAFPSQSRQAVTSPPPSPLLERQFSLRWGRDSDIKWGSSAQNKKVHFIDIYCVNHSHGSEKIEREKFTKLKSHKKPELQENQLTLRKLVEIVSYGAHGRREVAGGQPSTHISISTNTFCNLDKYILQFLQIHFAISTNTFCNL